MTLRTITAIGLSAAALAAISGATPAFATPAFAPSACGVAPAGAALTVLSATTCELDFSAAGTFNWTIPANVYGLQALLLGAGAGANRSPQLGYAGSGGSVRYVDYSTAAAGGIVGVVVGAGGASGSGDAGLPGENSTTTLTAVTSIAYGGAPAPLVLGSNYCLPEGNTGVYASNGNSATTTLLAASSDCATSYAPGLNPTTSTTDSSTTPRPAIFSTLNLTLGAGGRILATANPLLADAALNGTGNGADIHYTNTTNRFDGHNLTGGSGRVIFRYSIVPAAAAPALAATGSEVSPALTIAAVTAGLGAVLLAASRRRKRA